MAWWQIGQVKARPVKHRKLPKRLCQKCGRQVSIMSNIRRSELRDHICKPPSAATTVPPKEEGT